MAISGARFKLTIKSGLTTIISLDGIHKARLTDEELLKILDVEKLLEKILGFRFHIEEREEG